MRPARKLLDIAVTLRAVAERLESQPLPDWHELGALKDRAIVAANALLAARVRSAGAPEPQRQRSARVASLADRSGLPPPRYYLHGDREAGGDLFYCRACDLFRPKGHFEAADHGGEAEHWRRLANGYLALRRMAEAGRPLNRPSDAFNLFECRDPDAVGPQAAAPLVLSAFADALRPQRKGGRP